MTTAPWRTYLVRYGEIGIKSPAIRNRFEKRLIMNLEEAFLARGIEGAVEREWGRIYVKARETPEVLGVLTRTFGIVSASPAEEIPATMEAMCSEVAARSREIMGPNQSFAVRARRTGDQAYTSMDVQKQVGSAIFNANAEKNPRVDLTEPDVEFFLEVRPDKAFFYRDVYPGPGGLPLGTQGRVTAFIEHPESALALWLVMRRGCTVSPLAFEPVSEELREALTALADWAPGLKVATVRVPEAVRGPLARRRFAMEVMRRYTRGRRAYAVVVEDDFRGAARYAGFDEHTGGFPVFRPLVGYVGARRDRLVRAVGIGPLLGGALSGGDAEAPIPENVGDLAKEALFDMGSFQVTPRATRGPLEEARL
ncbi:MAG TPA: THUMP domain-containing protein [Candidatus Thermoplasmatota archaeon]|nr:THUMP domain-containing protein [Candidatus Thermoplasmatota archaeon]